LIFINLIRVAYVVRRPCSDFTDMLRRLINCRIIIIYYYVRTQKGCIAWVLTLELRRLKLRFGNVV